MYKHPTAGKTTTVRTTCTSTVVTTCSTVLYSNTTVHVVLESTGTLNRGWKAEPDNKTTRGYPGGTRAIVFREAVVTKSFSEPPTEHNPFLLQYIPTQCFLCTKTLIFPCLFIFWVNYVFSCTYFSHNQCVVVFMYGIIPSDTIDQ